MVPKGNNLREEAKKTHSKVAKGLKIFFAILAVAVPSYLRESRLELP